jgi:hypothetical protein
MYTVRRRGGPGINGTAHFLCITSPARGPTTRSVVTLLLHCCYAIVTLLLRYCYPAATMVSHCCHTVVTLLLLPLIPGGQGVHLGSLHAALSTVLRAVLHTLWHTHCMTHFIIHSITWRQHAEMKFRAWCSSFGPGTFVSNGTAVSDLLWSIPVDVRSVVLLARSELPWGLQNLRCKGWRFGFSQRQLLKCYHKCYAVFWATASRSPPPVFSV